MKLFEKIKSIFFKNKVKALPEASIETEKVVLLAVKERDPEKVLDILRTYCFEMNSNSIVHIIAHLPMKRRVEGIEIAQKYITPYDLSDLALRKLDYNGKISDIYCYSIKISVNGFFRTVPHTSIISTIFSNETSDRSWHSRGVPGPSCRRIPAKVCLYGG